MVHTVAIVAAIFVLIYGVACFFLQNFISGLIVLAVGFLSCVIFVVICDFLISVALDIKAIRNKIYDIENPVKSVEDSTNISVDRVEPDEDEAHIEKETESKTVSAAETESGDSVDVLKVLIYKRDMGEITQEEFLEEAEKIKNRNRE